ncbi:MAG: isoamylase early set domain-containing protein [Desulfamplus sp.]|nr:isoamylase early set domain-containing protein [Desulfamplus sp.]
MIIKKLIKSKPVANITFKLPSNIKATKAFVVGEFNNWDTTANPLRKTKGVWTTTLKLDTGKEYQFRYLVNDSEWHNDDAADDYVSNDFGSKNSVIKL